MPIIAVDGPAGSGKSSVCRGVAQRLGYRYLDTGAMYRAMTWAMLEAGVDIDDARAVAAACERPVIASGTDPAAPAITVDGVDVSAPIRGDAVTAAVSAVSAVPAVRERLVAIQRAVVADADARGMGIVVEGRDITSVVLPDADLRLYVTASAEARARRRAAQTSASEGVPVDVADTRTALLERDAKDSSREVSPLSIAEGVEVLDTSDLTLDEVIDVVSRKVGALGG